MGSSAAEQPAAEQAERRCGCEAPANPGQPSRFDLLYESDDGKLCLFETHDGHLSAVPSSLLA